MSVSRVDVAGFVRAEPTDDGGGLKLILVDGGGNTVVVSLPLRCLGALLADLPRQPAPAPEVVDEVQCWRLDPGDAGLTLTLQTPEGRVAAFRVTPGQIAGMATLATHATPRVVRGIGRTIN